VKVAIHQPQYLPWLGYLAKWAAADVFVFLDTVQYEKNGWQNRNRIKTATGVRWLTVPVHAPLGTPIHDVTIDAAQPWPRRHLSAIRHAYAGTPYLAAHEAALADFYARPWPKLAPLAVGSATWLARTAGIATRAVLASELDADASDPTGRLVALCRALKATTYLSGRDGVTYLDARRFVDAGVEVLVQDYTHPVYPQVHGGFAPNLSALDLLLMHGPASGGVLAAGNRWLPLG
jgi:WbqC-like protein